MVNLAFKHISHVIPVNHKQDRVRKLHVMFLQDQTLRIYCQHQLNPQSIKAAIDYLTSKHKDYNVSWFRSIENLVFLYGALFDEEGKIKRINRLVGIIREMLPNLELILESLLYNLALAI